MSQASSISIDDPSADCPVPLSTLARIIRSDPEALPDLVADLPEHTRARLAVYLYGRSHTHELGLRIAATCEGAALRRVAGFLGNTLYALSRQPYTPPSHGSTRPAAVRRISLGGSKAIDCAVAARL